MISLEETEEAVAFGIRNGAIIIFFHHGSQAFTYFIESDTAQFQEEMQNLERGVRRRFITSVTAGGPITIDGTILFPMHVRFENAPCYPYMLLRRRGMIDDADFTPYLFPSQQRRDEIVAFLTHL